MIIDDEDENKEDKEILHLVKLQKELSSIKKNTDISRAVVVAVSALSEAVEDMVKANKENVFYDKELREAITASLTKVGESLVEVAKDKIDLTPLIKENGRNYQAVASVILELQKQNKELFTLLSSPKPETQPLKLESFSVLANTIKINNDLISKFLTKENDYHKELSDIAKRPTHWKHTIQYENGIIKYIESKVI